MTRVVYDLFMTLEERATKVAYDSGEQTSYRLNRPSQMFELLAAVNG